MDFANMFNPQAIASMLAVMLQDPDTREQLTKQLADRLFMAGITSLQYELRESHGGGLVMLATVDDIADAIIGAVPGFLGAGE